LLLILILFIVTLSLYLGYAIGGKNTKIFVYTPSYNVDVCYVDEIDVQYYVSTHLNASLIYILLFHFCESMGFLYCIHKLKYIKDDFSIKSELYLVFGLWFSLSYLATTIFIYSPDNWKYLTFVLVIRNYSVCLITALKPVYQTYQNNSYILLPPSVGSIESLDMVLIIPIASEYFYDYLDK